MTAKEFLRQYHNAEIEIGCKLDEIVRLRELTTKTTSALGSDKVQTSAGNTLEKSIAKIVDMERNVGAALDNLQRIKAQVSNAIEQVPNATQRAVLERRYIVGETWEQIAVDLSYTYRNICYIHGKALNAITKILA